MKDELEIGRWRRTTLLVFMLASLPLPAAGSELRARAAALFGGIEPAAAEELADPVARLGRALFWDTRLSADGKTACASCHAAADWGADLRVRSPDARGNLTKRNSQTVFNAQAARAGLRWTADRTTGAAQALGSITGSMGFDSREALVAALRANGYAEAFRAAYPGVPDPMVAENYAQALEVYQRTLRTPAAFDRWLAGDDAALDAAQARGLQRFIDLGCAGCHSGALFGGAALTRFGLLEDHRPHTGSTTEDVGLMDATGREADRDVFRVQPLRNVARTAPYFHDGSVATLAGAISVMARVQLGHTLAADAVDDLLRFLDTLSGAVPSNYGSVPEE